MNPEFTIEKISNAVRALLIENGQQTSDVHCQSLLYHGIEVYVIELDVISSTMMLSEKWDKDRFSQNQAFVFFSKIQLQGKGQRQNTWSSPSGNLYMTILTNAKTQTLPYLSLIAAIQICDRIQSLGIQANIKWVNDIQVNSKKLGGILVKTNFVGDQCYAEIGIGINVNNSPVGQSSCLSEFSKGTEPISISTLGRKISLSIISKIYEYKASDRQEIVSEYKRRLEYLNRKVLIYDTPLQNILHAGIFVGINEYGFAIIQLDNGDRIQVSVGRMRLQQN